MFLFFKEKNDMTPQRKTRCPAVVGVISATKTGQLAPGANQNRAIRAGQFALQN